jgi:hypothetical protein
MNNLSNFDEIRFQAVLRTTALHDECLVSLSSIEHDRINAVASGIMCVVLYRISKYGGSTFFDHAAGVIKDLIVNTPSEEWALFVRCSMQLERGLHNFSSSIGLEPHFEQVYKNVVEIIAKHLSDHDAF